MAATADLLFMCQILHPDVSAPKRTNIMNVAAKLLALKTDSLGETFKMKDVCARMIGWLSKKNSYTSSLVRLCCAVVTTVILLPYRSNW